MNATEESLLSRTNKTILIVEFGAIFFLVPLAVWRQWVPVPLVMIPLYLLAGYAAWWLAKRGGFAGSQFWTGEDGAAEKALLKYLPLRIVMVTATLFAVVYLFYPNKLFALPEHHPLIWLLILLLYPPLSVYPQEVLYRAFFFERYRGLFSNRKSVIAASTLCFMFMHIVFGNAIALLATFIGGALFSDTYSRCRSLRLVCLEHSIYGYMIFTLGLGDFFVFGMAKSWLT